MVLKLYYDISIKKYFTRTGTFLTRTYRISRTNAFFCGAKYQIITDEMFIWSKQRHPFFAYMDVI